MERDEARVPSRSRLIVGLNETTSKPVLNIAITPLKLGYISQIPGANQQS